MKVCYKGQRLLDLRLRSTRGGMITLRGCVPPPMATRAMGYVGAKLPDIAHVVLAYTERLPADAGRISDMLFQVLKYDVFCDGTVGG